MSDEYKTLVASKSYIGNKGYTIPKNALSPEDLDFLKHDLMLKPENPTAIYGVGTNTDCEFPVYRENENKIYLPRFYGIERYGSPHKATIEPGININVPFASSLRDYQETIVDTYMKHVSTPIASNTTTSGSGGILQVFTGAGKCLGLNTPIMMFDGSIKMVQDVQVGDQIMGDDSTPRNVLSLARGSEMMYLVRPNTNSYDNGYVVNESHILSLKQGNYWTDTTNILDISVADYLNKSYFDKKQLFGYRVPITFEKKNVEIDPYTVGYWLGGEIDEIDPEFEKFIQQYHLDENPHIPSHYLCNEIDVQLQILAGLIDSVGLYYGSDFFEISLRNEVLINNIIYLCRSLGFSVYKVKPTTTYFTLMIYGDGIKQVPVLCLNPEYIITDTNIINYHKHNLKYKFELIKLGINNYYGFEIDGNRRFVLGDFTVTHNTVMALKIVSLIGKKTMILVHKEFLMNQWIERIQEFLPTAKIGRIQAQIMDIENKDIVLGMIQTIYNRTFSQDIYSQFGLTIIDEVHRIGSQEFSKTLLKTITPYMLGISATVERKDKLTKLLYMFIGKLVYSTERTPDDPVCVRGIEYQTNDAVFNETEVDYKGTPKFSTMISKLCEYGPRRDFIIRILEDLIKENPENQIMVLAHNRSLLTYLFETITFKNFATTGFYVGGMKPLALKETETKQIVLATFAMAAEALDIKSLSTLVMATPKTDIVQSVGRILRMKHENPIVVDIIDTHDIFQNQWRQRKRYYKKCNYRIRFIKSSQYKTMDLNWNNDITWFKVFEPIDKIFENGKSAEDDVEENKPEKNTTIFKGKCMIKIK
jgi:superfamily II DNA or RNA helicase